MPILEIVSLAVSFVKTEIPLISSAVVLVSIKSIEVCYPGFAPTIKIKDVSSPRILFVLNSIFSAVSITDYVLLLLKECLALVRAYSEIDAVEQNELKLKMQKIVFDLMSMTNRKSGERTRLFTFYMHINQCLIEVRLTKSKKHLKKVEAYLLEMLESWQSRKPIIENKGYKRQALKL